MGGTTKIADIIVPQVLGPMASAQISNYLDFEKTGVVVRDYNNINISDGGNFAEVPFYNQLDTSSGDEVLTDDTSMTPEKITTGKDIGVVCHRGKAWGSRDLAKILSGDDPQKEIARQVGSYWGKRLTVSLISVLNALFNASGPLGTGATNPHALKVGVTTGTKVTFTADGAIQTMTLLGDAMGGFDCFIMHSKVYGDLLRANLITWPLIYNPGNVEISTQDPGKFLGKQIIVSDNCPVDVGTPTYPIYTTYLAKKGAMYCGRQKDLMTETDRDILATQDVLATTIHFVPHVKLVKWNNTNTNPDNTALATYGNWTSVANDHKFIGMAAFMTN